MFDDENFNVFRDGNAVKEKEKINRTKLPRRARNLSKEQLQLALRKKKECNVKAQKIVESLLDPVGDVENFLLMLRDINQCHLEDVIQERAIQLVCGYPLCQKELSKVPNQKYVISLSNKKVYDITDRKNFCSGDCYKASNYIKGQMLTSPLWLRDQEDIPEFKLLSNSSPTKQPPQVAEDQEGAVSLRVEINVEELQIVERTYAEPATSSQNEGRENIHEGSEVDLSMKKDLDKAGTTDDGNDLNVKFDKMSLHNED